MIEGNGSEEVKVAEPVQPPAQQLTAEETVDLLVKIVCAPMTSEQIAQLENIKDATRSFILSIIRNCPYGLDRVGAIRKAREAMFLAQAAIEVPQVFL